MDVTGLVLLLLAFALLGFLTYLIVTYIPMPEPFKQGIVVIMVVFLVLYVLMALTGHASLPALR